MASGGEKRIRKISELTDEELEVEIWGKTGTKPRIDRAAIEYKRRFPFARDFRGEKGNPPNHVHVPPSRQMWRKALYPQFLRAVKVQEEKYEEEYRITCQKDDDDDQEALVPRSIDDYIKLTEDEKIATREFQRDIARYYRDEAKSRGFDVGSYPYRDCFWLVSNDYLYCYYKPPKVRIPKARFITLLHLSRWAILVYNSYQQKPTCYEVVQVLKAMSFGRIGTHLNITIRAASSSGYSDFQATVLDHSLPPEVSYSSFEIVLVRKLKSGEETDPPEIDYVGVRFLPKFPFDMVKLSDFDEKGPHSANVLHCSCDPTVPYPDWISLISVDLPRHLCEFALHQYNIALHRLDSDKDEDDEIYGKVKVLRVSNILRTLDTEHGTTYYVTFEASSLNDNGNAEVLEAKLFMSPLIPTTKIMIKFIRIKGS